MKLTRKQAKKISDNYDLGEVKSFKTIKEGWVNHNFILETEEGNFIVQVFGSEFGKWKKNKVKLEFEVLNYLKKKNFPYEIPFPIEGRSRKYVMKLGNNHLWVYRMIEGQMRKKINDKQLKEMVRSMAVYHKFIKDFKYKDKSDFDDYKWFFKQYALMRKVKPKNKVDRLMLKNIDFFEGLFRKVEKIKFGGLWLVTHSDIHEDNVVFDGNKLKGIIDFDNLKFAPRMVDATKILKFGSKKNNVNFFSEYEKIMRLSKKEKEMVKQLIIRDSCIVFWWYYAGMKKNKDKRYISILNLINATKKLAKELR